MLGSGNGRGGCENGTMKKKISTGQNVSHELKKWLEEKGDLAIENMFEVITMVIARLKCSDPVEPRWAWHVWRNPYEKGRRQSHRTA